MFEGANLQQKKLIKGQTLPGGRNLIEILREMNILQCLFPVERRGLNPMRKGSTLSDASSDRETMDFSAQPF